MQIDAGPEGSMFEDSTGDALRPTAGIMALLYLCLGIPTDLLLLAGGDRLAVKRSRACPAPR